MRKKLTIVIVASMFIITGCGKTNTVLTNYNSFVECVNTGDYFTAYDYVDTSKCMFMTPESFEESMYFIDTIFYKADKVKENNGSWNFISGDVSQSYAVSSEGKLILPELTTSLELYVPTGSSCTYNGVALNSSMITSSNEIETVYTIQAPISPGILHIDTELFGSSERTVDPTFGDYNNFSISDELSNSMGNAILSEVNLINNTLESGDKNKTSDLLGKYMTDTSKLDSYLNDFLDNRKLEDTFTSYHSPVYKISRINLDLDTTTSVIADVKFTVNWQVGEGAEVSMNTSGKFKVAYLDNSWKVTSIDNWDFMYLSVLGGE